MTPEYGDLNGPTSKKIGVPNGTPVVRLDETHQKAETYEDHDVDVLKRGIVVL